MAGSSVYPGALDNFADESPTNLGDNDSTGRTHSERHDDVEASVEAVQGELGLNPSGAFATVDARLDDIAGDVSALDSDVTVLQGDVSTLESDVTVLQGDVVDAAGSVVVLRNELVGFGSVLDPLPPRTPAGEQLLKQSVLWLDAAHNSAGGQTVKNLGWGGSALNAQSGSTTGVDSNDPKFLDWDGENYVYLPGVNDNFLSVPDEAALDITGDIDIRVQVAMDDWTPTANMVFVSKLGVPGQRSYEFRVQPNTGNLVLTWTSNGTTDLNAVATAPTVSDGSPLWVRVTLDVDNGASGHDAKFFTSPDGATWTQLGATITTAGTTSVFASTTAVKIGAREAFSFPLAGKFYRAQVFNGIDGTKVLDVDTSVITSGAATSFTALTGQTVTINRSTAGRKSVAVVSPVWLFGTDDYMQVADNDLIDFGAADSFTVLAVVRQWATPANGGRYVGKMAAGVAAGWYVATNGTSLTSYGVLADGPSSFYSDTGPTFSSGSLTLTGAVVNRSSQLLTAVTGSVLSTSPTSIAATGSLASATALNVGRNSGGGGFQDFELLAVAVFRRALTSTEITTITNYYSNRIGA